MPIPSITMFLGSFFCLSHPTLLFKTPPSAARAASSGFLAAYSPLPNFFREVLLFDFVSRLKKPSR